MTAAIVIVDHLDEIGAFQKASKVTKEKMTKVSKFLSLKLQIHIKNAIGALNTFDQKEPKGKAESLLNALRYSTLTLNKPETPVAIKQMLNV